MLFRSSQGWRIVIGATTWAGMEYIRTWGTLTMPWAQLSYSQFHFLSLLQWADVAGGYGISFLLVLLNGGVGYAWWNRGEEQCGRWAMLYGTVILLLSLAGYAKMQIPAPSQTIRVASMQGNFSTESSAEQDRKAFATITQLTREALQKIGRAHV